MGNDITWWKDRDQWMPRRVQDGPQTSEQEEEQRVSPPEPDELANDDADQRLDKDDTPDQPD